MTLADELKAVYAEEHRAGRRSALMDVITECRQRAEVPGQHLVCITLYAEIAEFALALMEKES